MAVMTKSTPSVLKDRTAPRAAPIAALATQQIWSSRVMKNMNQPLSTPSGGFAEFVSFCSRIHFNPPMQQYNRFICICKNYL